VKLPENVVHGRDEYWVDLNEHLQEEGLIKNDERLTTAVVEIDANGKAKLREYTTLPLTR
jgi:hypothetical protein